MFSSLSLLFGQVVQKTFFGLFFSLFFDGSLFGGKKIFGCDDGSEQKIVGHKKLEQIEQRQQQANGGKLELKVVKDSSYS